MSSLLAASLLIVLFLFSGCASEPPLVNQYGTAVPPLPTLDSSAVARGKQIYQLHCAVCHGGKAEGAVNWKVPDENLNYPPPPHDDTGHTWHHSDRVIYEAIHDGILDPSRPNQPMRMRGFGDELSDVEIDSVIVYFKSLWSREHREFQYLRTTEDEIENPTPNAR